MKDKYVEVKLIHDKPTRLLTIGEKDKALLGQVVPSMEKNVLKASDYLFGVGASTPRGIETTGESVVIGGNCYTRCTDESSPDYLNIISNKDFRSAATMFIEKSATANGSIRSLKSQHLSKFYYYSMQEIPCPTISMIGIAKFKSIYVNTVHKAPIHGVSLKENKRYYFPYPTKTLKNVYGVLISHLYKKGSSLEFDSRFENLIEEYQESPDINTAFDVNLGEKSIFNKSRFMVLNKAVSSYENITPADVSSIWIVYLKESILTDYRGEFFLVNQIINKP